jgi:hypothetical protein
MGTLIMSGYFKGAASPGRCLVKQKDDIAAIKQLGPDSGTFLGFKRFGEFEEIVDFLRCKMFQS